MLYGLREAMEAKLSINKKIIEDNRDLTREALKSLKKAIVNDNPNTDDHSDPEAKANFEIIEILLRSLPALDDKYYKFKDKYHKRFLQAVETDRVNAIQAFLLPDLSINPSVEALIRGLSIAVERKNKAGIEVLAEAVQAIPTQRLRAVDQSALLDVLKTLIRAGQFFPYGENLYHAHSARLSSKLEKLAEVAAQSEQLNVLEFLFSKDHRATQLHPEDYLNTMTNCYKSSPALAKILLTQVVIHRCHMIPVDMLAPLLACLKELQATSLIKHLVRYRTNSIKPEMLNDLLEFALSENKTSLVRTIIAVLRKPSLLWVKSNWSPSFENFVQAINLGEETLLALLLDNENNSVFVKVLNSAIHHAAFMGNLKMVSMMLEKLIDCKAAELAYRVVHTAAQHRHGDIIDYLFDAIPNLTLDEMREAIAHAPQDFRPEVEALIQKSLAKVHGNQLLKGTLKLLKAHVKCSEMEVRSDNVMSLLEAAFLSLGIHRDKDLDTGTVLMDIQESEQEQVVELEADLSVHETAEQLDLIIKEFEVVCLIEANPAFQEEAFQQLLTVAYDDACEAGEEQQVDVVDDKDESLEPPLSDSPSSRKSHLH